MKVSCFFIVVDDTNNLSPGSLTADHLWQMINQSASTLCAFSILQKLARISKMAPDDIWPHTLTWKYSLYVLVGSVKPIDTDEYWGKQGNYSCVDVKIDNTCHIDNISWYDWLNGKILKKMGQTNRPVNI